MQQSLVDVCVDLLIWLNRIIDPVAVVRPWNGSWSRFQAIIIPKRNRVTQDICI